MRLSEIERARGVLGGIAQPLPEGDFSDSVGISFALHEKESLTRIAKRALARPALAAQRKTIRKRLGFDLPFWADAVTIGEQFADEAAWSYMLSRLPPMRGLDVLIPGCYMGGEDVQFWLRRGICRLEGIDIYALTSHWSSIVPALKQRWGVPVGFRQGSIEEIPFPDAEFDVMSSAAVLEHVRIISRMVNETARVLKPGGFALHSFGPLYYSFGADHCISAYGPDAGYDHLLLEEAEYRKRISDRDFFKSATGNEDLAFWALNDQFSFATASEYLRRLAARFEIKYVAVKISPDGLAYRDRRPDNWRWLLSEGISEADLLIKGLTVVLRKSPVAMATA